MKLFDGFAIEEVKVSTENINEILASISTEDFFSDVGGKIKGALAYFSDLFKSLTVAGSIENDEALVRLMKQITLDIAALNKYPEQKRLPDIMYSVRRTIMGAPEGFKGDLYAFVKTLIETSTEVNKMLDVETEQYLTILSNLVTNKESRLSSNDYKHEMGDIIKKNQMVSDSIQSFFNHKSSSGSIVLQELVDSYNAVLKMENDVFKLSKLNQFKGILTAQANVSKISDLLTIITNLPLRNKDSDPKETIDAKTLVALSNYTNVIATMYTNVTAVRMYTEVVIKMYANILETLRSKL